MNAAIQTLQSTRFIRQLQLREFEHLPDDPPRRAALESDIADLDQGIIILDRALREVIEETQGKAGAQC